MKTLLLSLCVIFAVGCASLTGCKSVQSVEVGGGYTQSTGTWSVGITIVFKSAPALEVAGTLANAGAVRVSDTVWTFPTYDRKSAAQGNALETALRAGGTITGTK